MERSLVYGDSFESPPFFGASCIMRIDDLCWVTVLRSCLLTLTLGGSLAATSWGQELPDLTPTTAQDRVNSWERHERMRQASPFKELSWRSVGPRKQGGRIESIACPAGNTSVMYIGVGSGNVWKTENLGTTWAPVFEHESTGAIGDLAVAPSNSDVVWVGTGEVLMARSALPGMGVFKSTDAGKTWRNMGLTDSHHIGRVLIDPNDENIVFAAVIGHQSSPNRERGLFRTVDGGEAWDHVLYIDEQTSVIDIAFEPGNSKTIYATSWQRDVDGQDHVGVNSGVHKSTDGGSTWKRLEGGLPSNDKIGRIAIDVATSNPKVVYALFDLGDEDGLFRSNDAGETWTKVNQDPVRAQWDWCEIRISPDDENEVYSINQTSIVSRDGGATFSPIAGTVVHLLDHDARMLHLDTHAMWINPNNTDHVVFGNDGGVFVTYDRCKTWLHLNNLPIAECYAVTYDMESPYNIYIGTQDNAALFGPSTHEPKDGEPDEWEHVYLDRWGGGDSYFTYRDPSDPDTIYYEHQYGDMRRKNMRTGRTIGIRPRAAEGEPRLRFAWMTPFFPSFHEPTTLYAAADRVFKSLDRGETWSPISELLTGGSNPPNIRYQAITSLAESPRKPGLLFAGTDNGNVFVTEDDGTTWTPIHDTLPRTNVTRVYPSPHNEQTVFVTMSGMLTDNFLPLVYRSDDLGKTWKLISMDLPLEPVNVIREDPDVPNQLYLGTDLGIYMSRDGGDTWQSLCNNLPTVAVHDLFIHPRERELVIGTHGRSVYVLDVSHIKP